MVKNGAFLLLLVLGCTPLAGCGALVAGAAGGAIVHEIDKHNRPCYDPYYCGPGYDYR